MSITNIKAVLTKSQVCYCFFCYDRW